MSAVIAEPKLEGQTLPFSHKTRTVYNVIKIQTHSSASPYAAQVVFTLRLVSVGLCLYLQASVHPHFSMSTSISVPMLVHLIGHVSVGILICNLCHMSLAFAPTVFTVTTHYMDACRMRLGTQKRHNEKQTKLSNTSAIIVH